MKQDERQIARSKMFKEKHVKVSPKSTFKTSHGLHYNSGAKPAVYRNISSDERRLDDIDYPAETRKRRPSFRNNAKRKVLALTCWTRKDLDQCSL